MISSVLRLLVKLCIPRRAHWLTLEKIPRRAHWLTTDWKEVSSKQLRICMQEHSEHSKTPRATEWSTMRTLHERQM